MSSDSLALLEELVSRGEFGSETEAVRKAVEDLIDSHILAEEKAHILEKVAKRSQLSIKDFTSDGSDGEEVLKNVIARGLERGDDA